MNTCTVIHWGLKKNLSSCLGQVDFPFEQVAFIGTCSMGKGLGKLPAFEALKEKSKSYPGQATCTCPKGKPEFKIFYSPVREWVICFFVFLTSK